MTREMHIDGGIKMLAVAMSFLVSATVSSEGLQYRNPRTGAIETEEYVNQMCMRYSNTGSDEEIQKCLRTQYELITDPKTQQTRSSPVTAKRKAIYVPEKMPICFDGDSLKKYADYVAYQNVSGIGALMDAGRCITVRKGQHMRIPENHNREMAGGEYPAITFSTPKGGMTAWVLEVTVVSE